MSAVCSRFLALSLLAALGCQRPTVQRGHECVLNSDCDDPLVCELGSCRIQCTDDRDCGAGLNCFDHDRDGTGGCQLDTEIECSASADCIRPELVCLEGRCQLSCREDRDCEPGVFCTENEIGERACHDVTTDGCVYTSDCPAPLVCGIDRQCRLECVSDRDCLPPRRCSANVCQLLDAATP